MHVVGNTCETYIRELLRRAYSVRYMDRRVKKRPCEIANAKSHRVFDPSTPFLHNMPVSICKEDLPKLAGIDFDGSRVHEYVMSWKADGVRKILGFIQTTDDQPLAFALDGNGSFSTIDIEVPLESYNGTILEVEFVGDRCLIFDVVLCYGVNVYNLQYPVRIGVAVHWLNSFAEYLKTSRTQRPRLSNRKSGGNNCLTYPGVDFSTIVQTGKYTLRVKELFQVQQLKQLPCAWDYPTDGLIWTSVCGNNVYKWKPLHRITIDLKVLPPYQSADSLSYVIPHGFYDPRLAKYRTHSGQYKLSCRFKGMDFWFTSLDVFSNGLPSPTAGEIYEFEWVNGAWLAVKPRPDKPQPNNLLTVCRTINNIEEAIDRTTLESGIFE